MKQVRAAVRIRGLVQGVNFRYFTRRTAEAHNVTGWVKNLPNGEVEALFEGREAEVRKVLAWCHEGPSSARVDEVRVEWKDFRGEFSSFNVVR